MVYPGRMRRWVLGLAVCLAMVSFETSVAQIDKRTAIPAGPQNAHPLGGYKVPLIAKGLRLSDFAGMEPRPELKDKLLKISGFIQNSPRDGEPGSEATEVWIGRTKYALYFVFVCHYHHTD